jgi:hypothetical protein
MVGASLVFIISFPNSVISFPNSVISFPNSVWERVSIEAELLGVAFPTGRWEQGELLEMVGASLVFILYWV